MRGWAQWTNSLARLLLSFPLYVNTSEALHRTTRPLLRWVIYSQPRADRDAGSVYATEPHSQISTTGPFLRIALFII